MKLRVHLQPRASRSEIVGERAGALAVRVTAPPADGKANDALRKLLAKRLGIAPSRVSVVRGHKAREKVVELAGVEPADVRKALNLGAD